MTRQEGVWRADLFVAVNVVLFGLLCLFVWFVRIGRSHAPGNVAEFFLYALAILALVLAAWWRLRRLAIPALILVLLQAGILLHFAGAFVPAGGGRLYDASVVGIGYDKLVHLFNGFAGAALFRHLAHQARHPLPWRRLLIFVLVLGVGALFEILEFAALIAVPDAGVGDYANNMGDLIANGAGAACLLALDGAIGPPKRRGLRR